LQKKKVIAVVLLVAVIVITIVGYEFFVADSLSGYTKMTLIANQPNSIKFGNNLYGLIFSSPNGHNTYVFSVSTIDSSEGFSATKGAKYSFSGLQIAVGKANSNQLILYVKPLSTSSGETISPTIESTVSPSSTSLPTPYPSTEPSNEVVVSGTVSYCQNGTITFLTSNYSGTTFISDSKYTAMLIGGQSYNVTISYQGTQGEEMQFATVNVPTGVTYFTANF
jgi:hypothetical protein